MLLEVPATFSVRFRVSLEYERIVAFLVRRRGGDSLLGAVNGSRFTTLLAVTVAAIVACSSSSEPSSPSPSTTGGADDAESTPDAAADAPDVSVPACIEIDQPCTGDVECCEERACSDGRCCVALGRSCTAAADCCGAPGTVACLGETCCMRSGVECESSSDCCAGQACVMDLTSGIKTCEMNGDDE